MQFKKRTVIVGLDGVSHSTLVKLFQQGVMPHFKALSSTGVLKPMMSSLPDNSAVSWASIMTGTNPGEHGIFGFTDLIPNTYSLRFPNFLNIKTAPFWSRQPDKKHVIINLPFSYPAQPLNGCLISGFVSPDLAKSVYPESLLPYLERENYQTDVDAKTAHQSLPLFFEELIKVHQIRSQIYKHLWSELPWDVFFLVFTGTDRIGHFMQHAFANEHDINHNKFLEYFSLVDNEIGWIAEQLTSHDRLIMLSDHGMEVIRTDVNLNTLLEHHGLLRLKEGQCSNYTLIEERSRAFALEPSRIYLNYKDRFPNGSVAREHAASTIAELKTVLSDLTHEGDKVVQTIYEKHDIYQGNEMESAPDLVIVANNGFNLRGSIGKPMIFEKNQIVSGMHQGSNAFLFVAGSHADELVPQHPHVEHIVQILHHLEEY